MTKIVLDAGEVMGELEDMSADLGRAVGTLYLCKRLRNVKVGRNSIENEAAMMWKESCQRPVGGLDNEADNEADKRNIRVVMEKVSTFRTKVAISVKEGRLRFEEKVKEALKERGIRLCSRGPGTLR